MKNLSDNSVTQMIVLATLTISIVALTTLAAPPRSNHIGFNVRLVIIPTAMGFVYGIWSIFASDSKVLPISICTAAIILIALIIFMDYNNLLIEYELWLQRGMPARWTH